MNQIPSDELARYRKSKESAKGEKARQLRREAEESLGRVIPQLRTEAVRMREHCPTLWEYLEIQTCPRPGRPAIQGEQCAGMDFSQIAAYRMGQHSIIEWIKYLVEVENG